MSPKKQAMRYPFFIIIDDGGFEFAVQGDRESKIGMETYSAILKLAKEFHMRIPICLTMKFLDKENISGVGTPLDYVEELVAFLKHNQDYIEIGYHGLTHEYKGHTGEFYCLDIDEPVPEKIQREHISKSKEIFEYWNLEFPKLFVPPYHGWEVGTTDKILSENGVKYLVSTKQLSYDEYNFSPCSKYLKFLPRRILGISHHHYNLDEGKYLKFMHLVRRKISPNYVKGYLIPRNPVANIMWAGHFREFLHLQPVHSYMTHIGNFTPHCYNFWRELLSWVKGNNRLVLCQDNEMAIDAFLQSLAFTDSR